MSGQNNEVEFRRILVALDASHPSLAALEAAVELAASMKAKLEGLYVEDINLLQAAGSPVAREVRFPFVSSTQLDPNRMTRQLRAQAKQAERALAAACQRREIEWSFRVVRGEVSHEVMAAAREVDMLILGKASRPLVRKTRLGSTALTAAVQSPCCVLLLQRGERIAPPVIVVYDGSPVARRALRVATRLAGRNGGYLAVLLVAETASEEYRLQAETADWLRRQGVLVRYRRIPERSVLAVKQVLEAERNGLVVFSSTVLHLAELQRLLNEIHSPVLLVH
jgi:nucleotide-binding universal stress UspA family protein